MALVASPGPVLERSLVPYSLEVGWASKSGRAPLGLLASWDRVGPEPERWLVWPHDLRGELVLCPRELAPHSQQPR